MATLKRSRDNASRSSPYILYSLLRVAEKLVHCIAAMDQFNRFDGTF
jgi:hypothetical protein